MLYFFLRVYMENQTIQNSMPEPVPVPESKTKDQRLTRILFVLILILLSCTVYLAYQNYQLRKQISELPPTPSPLPSQGLSGAEVTPSPIATPDETANWKIYNNDKYKITFNYPPSWTFFAASRENYNNPNKEQGFRDECLVNFSQVFTIQNPVNTPWGTLGSLFDLEISVTNPEKWSAETWINNCRGYLTSEPGYNKETKNIKGQNVILLSKEGEPGNGGIATDYTYVFKSNNNFYLLRFQNHKYANKAETSIQKVLETIVFK